jgi:hypothetical protein
MGGFAGRNGSVYLPGTPNTPISDITTWTVSISADNYDASVLGDSWKEYVIGLRGWSGKISGFYNLVNDPAGQATVYNAMLAGNSIVLVMQTGTAAGNGFWEGTANITAADVSNPVNNVISLDFTYVGTGSLQYSGAF